MLRKEDWMEIKAARDKGQYIKDIAEEVGVHPKTVRRALQREGAPSGKRPGAKGSKLDPYKAAIDGLMQEGVWNAVVVLRSIEAAGYDGEITIVRDYMRPKRAMRKSRATVRFETLPGRQMQSDWGEVVIVIGDSPQKVFFIVNQLGYSRRFHFWGTARQDAEHTYDGIIRSFEYFGGVTAEVLVDNQKSAVLTHRGRQVEFNPRFVDLAGHYGFSPRACRPYRAQTKGKDERMVGYIKHNFFQRHRRFDSLAHLNQLAEKWLAEEADLRVHGTVKEVVQERFQKEAPHLQSLPLMRYDTSYQEYRTVAWDGYIEVRGNRYSVPHNLSGSMVRIHLSLEAVLSVYAGDEKVAEHPLKPASEGWATESAHHRELWRQTLRVQQRDLAVYEEVAGCSS